MNPRNKRVGNRGIPIRTMEQELVRQARQGDRAAAERLLTLCRDKVFGYLLRMLRNRDLAEDAAQETLIRVLRGLDRYKEQGTFTAWLFHIARGEGLRAAKQQSRNGSPGNGPRLEDVAANMEDPGPTPLEQAQQREQARQLEAALAKLPDQEKEVALLRLTQGLAFKEIAGITQSPLNTVLSRMRRATAKLRKEIAGMRPEHEQGEAP